MSIDDLKLAFFRQELGFTGDTLNELAYKYYQMKLGV